MFWHGVRSSTPSLGTPRMMSPPSTSSVAGNGSRPGLLPGQHSAAEHAVWPVCSTCFNCPTQNSRPRPACLGRCSCAACACHCPCVLPLPTTARLCTETTRLPVRALAAARVCREAGCESWCAGCTGSQGICPRCPVSFGAVAGRTAQPEAAMPESKLRARHGECRQLVMQVGVQQGRQTRTNGSVVGGSRPCCGRGGQHADGILRPGRRTVEEKQPGRLSIPQARRSLQKKPWRSARWDRW